MSDLLGSPHHDGSPLYTPGPPPGIGDTVPVRVWVPSTPGKPADETEVYLRRWRDAEPVVTRATLDTCDGTGAWFTAEVTCDHQLNHYRFLLAGDGYRWLNASGVWDRDVADAYDFRISTADPPPDWIADQIVYQVFPDRFARSAPHETPGWADPAAWDDDVDEREHHSARQWYGGDLDGIAAHLDVLDDLSATTLYMTPVFTAGSVHRYDAASFDHVDQALGGDEALARLLTAAHARGIRVVGDLTLNHTGSTHEWFICAQADLDRPCVGFYLFRSHPHDYVSWWNIPSLPKLNHTSSHLRHELYEGPGSVVARWLDFGLDGWRIDVANMVGRLGPTDVAHEVARTVRATMAAHHRDAWLLAEAGHDAARDGDIDGDGWHGTMDYSGFTRPVWTWLNSPAAAAGMQYLGLPVAIPRLGGQALVATMREIHAGAPWRSWLASTLHLDSHDTPRFRTVTGGGDSGHADAAGAGRAAHLVGLALQMTMPGVPSIFCGDELGMTGRSGEHSRTPYPWDGNRADLARIDAPTLAAYRTWTALRRNLVALRRGSLRFVDAGHDSVTYLREHPDQRVLVHVARGPHGPVSLPLSGLGLSSAAQASAAVPDDPTSGSIVASGVADDLALAASGPGAAVWVLE
ncbi:MAG: alpha-amylase family glycosyl hydrolase [Micrococcales bacterium]|nr:alpha-amylase family glycosyl hydrolase [Micrococcales bacterium]MCL2667517.1 alpha-amylase family glycosyl hydrolase [Micrococcales bacterium]